MLNDVLSVGIKAQVTSFIAGFKAAETAVKNFASSANKDIKWAAEPFTKYDYEVARVTKSIGRLGLDMDRVFVPLVNKAKVAILGLTAATAAVGVAAFKIGAPYDQQLRLVKGITGSTEKEFNELKQAGRDLAKELPLQLDEIGRAMYTLASSGLSVKEIGQAIAPITRLAVAQHHDLAEATDMVTAAIKAYGLEFTQTNKVVDLFNNSITGSLLTMDKLQYALRYSGPIAHELGISLQDTLKATMALSNTGATGEQLGTGLRTVLAQLVKPSRETAGAAETLKRLKVAIFDASGAMRPLADIFEDFRKAGMTAKDVFAVWGREGSSAASALLSLGKGIDAFGPKLQKMGKTNELMGEMLKSPQAGWDVLINNLKDIFVTGFEQMSPKMNEYLSVLKQLAQTFDYWTSKANVFSKVFSSIAAGFGLTIPDVTKFREYLESIDLDKVSAQIRSFASDLKTLGDLIISVFKAIPWDFIRENMSTISDALVVGWASGKVLRSIESIRLLSKSLHDLYKSLEKLKDLKTDKMTFFGMIGSRLPLAALTALAALMGKGVYDSAIQGRDAMNDFNNTLGKTDEQLTKLSREELRGRVERLSKFVSDMNGQIGGANGLTDADRSPMIKYEEQLERLKNVLLKVDQASALSIGKKVLNDELRKLEGLTDSDLKKLKELNKEVKGGPGTTTFGGGAKAVVDVKALDSAIEEVMKQYRTLEDQSKEAMRTLGLSAVGASDIVSETLRDSIIKTGKDIAKTMSPAQAQSFLERLESMGSKIGGAFQLATKNISETKSTVDALKDSLENLTNPLKAITDAIAGGFFDPRATKTAVDWITKSLPSLAELTKQQLANQFGKLGLPKELLTGLANSMLSGTLQNAGLTSQNGLASGNYLPSGFVRQSPTQNNTITVKIGNVNVKDTKDAQKVGQGLGQGIVQSFETGW